MLLKRTNQYASAFRNLKGKPTLSITVSGVFIRRRRTGGGGGGGQNGSTLWRGMGGRGGGEWGLSLKYVVASVKAEETLGH